MKNSKVSVKTAWKSKKTLPRILRINRVSGYTIFVLFSNGQNRILDFKKIFRLWKVKRSDKEYKLLQPGEFKKVILENYSLCWPEIKTEIKLPGGKTTCLPFQPGADTLYELSEPDSSRDKLPLGEMIRKARLKAGLTQEELGKRIGSDKFYISRIEANRFHVEISTLKKIVEGGLRKRLHIHIK